MSENVQTIRLKSWLFLFIYNHLFKFDSKTYNELFGFFFFVFLNKIQDIFLHDKVCPFTLAR